MSQTIQKIILICARDNKGTLFLLQAGKEKYPSFLISYENDENFLEAIQDKLENNFNLKIKKNSLKKENYSDKLTSSQKTFSCELYLLEEKKESFILDESIALWITFPKLFKEILEKDEARRTYLRFWQVLMGPE